MLRQGVFVFSIMVVNNHLPCLDRDVFVFSIMVVNNHAFAMLRQGCVCVFHHGC